MPDWNSLLVKKISFPVICIQLQNPNFMNMESQDAGSCGSKEIPLLHETIFDKSISTFIIRISGETTEQDVINCFQNYYKVVEENFDNRDFSIIINVDEEAHSSIAVLRLIRSCLENQEHRDYIANVVAVNENPIRVTARNSTSDNLLPFFINEAEARQYISAKLQHKTHP